MGPTQIKTFCAWAPLARKSYGALDTGAMKEIPRNILEDSLDFQAFSGQSRSVPEYSWIEVSE